MDVPYFDHTTQHADIWSVIIQKVAEPRTDTVISEDNTVYLIWLMQVSRGFERLVKKYFEQMRIKPFEISAPVEPVVEQVRLRFVGITEHEIRYGIKVKRRNVECNVHKMGYSIVRDRKVTTLTFVFDMIAQCNKIFYTDSNGVYCLMFSGKELESVERRAVCSEMRIRHIVYFGENGVVDMFKNMGKSFASFQMDNIRLSPDNPEYDAFLHDARKIHTLASKWKDQAARDLFGAHSGTM